MKGENVNPSQADRDAVTRCLEATVVAIAAARAQGRQEAAAELAAVKDRCARVMAEMSARSVADAEQFARVQEERTIAKSQLAAIREAAKPLKTIPAVWLDDARVACIEPASSHNRLEIGDLRKLLAAIGEALASA